MPKFKKITVKQYRVLNPFALPKDAIIIQKEGVGQFRQGDVLDELTARRLGAAGLLANGVLEVEEVEA